MSDLISRQAAIDALKNDMASLDHIIKGTSANDVRLDVYVSQRNQVNYDIYTINNLPPAHGTNLAEVGTELISRQSAIDAIRDMQAFEDDNGQPYLYLYDVMAVFTDEEELPTIQPEPHWIPVDLENNEPQLEEWVLVSSDGYVMQDCIVERGGKKIWYHGGNIQADDRYMPLPEPYKGVTE